MIVLSSTIILAQIFTFSNWVNEQSKWEQKHCEMWSGAHGSTHDSGARGLGFDPTPKPSTAFLEALISLLEYNRLKSDFVHL